MTDLPFGTTPNDRDEFARTWGNAEGPLAWLRAVNNAPIGRRFLITGFVFFLIGGVQALAMRLQLARGELEWLSPELYNQLMTMHGSTMMFLFVVPILEGFATVIAPAMLGTRDLPFPRLTAFAYWAYLFGGILMYSSFLVGAAPDGGWFAYVPLTGPEFSPGVNMDFWLLGLELAEASGIISAFELIIAVLTMRAPGMTLGRMPVFLWAMLVVSAMILFAFMTVLLASLFLELDRKVGTAFYDPEMGGSPLLWQHLFWFFGHPEVYIQFLPATGMISMMLPVFARRRLVSYTAVVLALVATGFLSFGLWAHHMFTTGLDTVSLGFFSAASITVAIPTGVQFFVWIATIWRGRVVWKTPMLFVAGFLVIFLLGGLSGVMVGVQPFDEQVHDSFFVVAHFHYVLIGGVVFPLIGAFYYWMPKITGHLMSERLGRWNFWTMAIGFNLAFFPMHVSGLLGMPRRVYTYRTGLGWDPLNLLSTIGAFVFAIGVLLFVVNFVRAVLRDDRAGPNPWGAATLEFATESPAPPYGFRRLPIVRSRYPLWDQERLDVGDEATDAVVSALERWPTRWQAAIVTDVFTGRLKEVFWLPNNSYMPLLAALGLAVTMGALIYDWYIAALVGLVVALAAYVKWMVPIRHDAHHDAEREAPFREHGVNVYIHSSPTVARWTVVLTMVIALVTLGTFLFSYFYLAVNGAGPWAPEIVPGGGGLAAVGGALMALATAAGVRALAVARRGRADADPDARRLERGPALVATAVAVGLGVAAGVVEVLALARLGFGFREHAFGSITWLLAGLGLTMLFTALVMSSIAWARLAGNHVRSELERVRVTVVNAGIVWGVAALTWATVFLTVHLAPFGGG